ncbi:hypothetical protein OSB04_021975 [Centaurea solstitialis]|uniref:Uncharacterized protein n=1 Tax=Centaurea solstitialis TaxID=347529 RepID=A0AA38TDK5_9ASTR|nr:hypothetical protein OSB04_021975 [Centaurea solstitialis]
MAIFRMHSLVSNAKQMIKLHNKHQPMFPKDIWPCTLEKSKRNGSWCLYLTWTNRCSKICYVGRRKNTGSTIRWEDLPFPAKKKPLSMSLLDYTFRIILKFTNKRHLTQSGWSGTYIVR